MAKYDKIPDNDHVLRYAGYNRLQRHPESDRPIRLEHQAFKLKPVDEGELSVTWVEFFDGGAEVQTERAVRAYRKSMKTPMKRSNKGAFGKAIASSVSQAFNDHPTASRVRLVHDPEDMNPGHAVITNFQDGFSDLLELLAATVFEELILNCDIPDEA